VPCDGGAMEAVTGKSPCYGPPSTVHRLTG
jgi:hypothetical protein